MSQFGPIFFYSLAVVGFAAFSLLAPHLIAPRKKTVVKEMPYESGMDPVDDARKPLDVQFYLLAILFLVFDVGLLLVLPYAVALRAEDGLPAAFRPAALGVLAILLGALALAYVASWRKGVFQWRQSPPGET